MSFRLDQPQKRKRKSKRKRNGTAKTAARGFESPTFFGGLRGVGRGEGLAIPQLGEEFNTRFGKIGTGFVENVDTFKIGFAPQENFGFGRARTPTLRARRGRGRPRKVATLLAGPKKKAPKGTKTVGAILAGKVTSGFKKLRGDDPSSFTPEQLASEKRIDTENVQRLQVGLQQEIESQIEDEDIDMTETEVEEDDEEILDEDMEKSEFKSTEIDLGRGRGEER